MKIAQGYFRQQVGNENYELWQKAKTIQVLKSSSLLINNHIIIKIIKNLFIPFMSSYDAFYEIKSGDNLQNYLENLDELFFDHPKNLDLNYQEKKEEPLDPTNFSQKQPRTHSRSGRPVTLIDVNKDTVNNFIHTKRGKPNQTMQLLPNFKTFIVRKLKDLLIIKVLSRHQTMNCLNFIKNKPSFESINSLLSPVQKCGQLRNSLVELFDSTEIIRELMVSGIRLEQKMNLIKYIDRMRDQIQNTRKLRKWKHQLM